MANTVEGYLPDGSVVYEDGHVVDRNGNSWYPGNQGEQIACNGQSCYISSNNTGYVTPYNSPQYGVQFYGNSRNVQYDRNNRNDRNNQNYRDTRRPPNA